MDTANQTLRVLIIDHYRDGADALAMLLRILGFETRAIYSGLDALVAAEDFSPDCIVSDIGPPGLDGFKLAKRFRRHESFKRTPLIALTGYLEQGRAKSAGFDHHLMKPASSRVIAQLIRELTSRSLARTPDSSPSYSASVFTPQ